LDIAAAVDGVGTEDQLAGIRVAGEDGAGHRPASAAAQRGGAVGQHVVQDLVARAGRVELEGPVTVGDDVVVDEVITAGVVQVDPGCSVAAGADVIDAVVADLAAAPVGAVGIDAAAVGGLEHDVVDEVVEHNRAAGVTELDSVAAAIVDGIALNAHRRPQYGNSGGVGGVVVGVVDDAVEHRIVRPVHVHPVAGAEVDLAVFQDVVHAGELDAAGAAGPTARSRGRL
jgi:hypothetical protein